VCKKGDCWLTKHTKEQRNEVREGFKRCVYQYLTDNDINDDFDKDIAPTTISGNFFYDDYGVKHFITLNRLILIETAKNIVISINNNAFIYSFTSSIKPGSIEPSSIEPGIVRYGNKVNTENLTVDIDFLNCHFDDNG